MDRCVAVVDIGKTNKKVHVYSNDLRLVASESTSFDTVERDGILWVDSDALETWLLDTLLHLAPRHAIAAVSVTTHGATFACVDESGYLAFPVIDYTHEPGGSFHDEFFEIAGDPAELQRTTATLELSALLNVAQGVRFLQVHDPDRFARVRHILFYPQYIAYRLTGRIAADFTYAGCHTYLYDFARRDYSVVADRLGIRALLPERMDHPQTVLGRVDPAVAGRTGLSPETVVTLGIHDSNASLLPYLIKRPDEDLIVNSTGTWCVAMHPEPEVSFSDDEIGKAVFYNICAFGTPVKTSILMGGLEFETYTRLLRDRFGMRDYPDFDPQLYRDVIKEKAEFILPAVVPGTGQFPDSTARVVDHGEVFGLDQIRDGSRVPELFSNSRRAYAVLNLSLAVQTLVALRRVGLRAGTTVYTEGGFRNNADYNALLAALVPDSRFLLSGMPEATSFGAALIGRAALEGVDLSTLAGRFDLQQDSVPQSDLPGIDAYASAFLDLVAAG
ncbi:MAG: carbohydrate kinase [Spirochaetaceae bacterium]|nr:MAG: carbohydrate kinase [Spirochaetaceae bacterium]